MTIKHFIYSKETTPYTWVTPAKAIWVDSAQTGGGREALPQRTTGVGRSPLLHVPGAKPITEAVSMKWWLNNVGTIFSTFLRTSAISNPTAGIYDHGLLYDDEQSFLALSIQKQHTRTLGFNLLGAAVNGVTLSAASKEEAKLEWDLLCKDEAKCGGVWDYDGVTVSPAIIATPTYPSVKRPFVFYDSQVIVGGTPAYNDTEKKISIAGGTAYAKVRNLSVALGHNLDADAFGLVQDPTLQEISPGDRTIEVSFDLSWTDYLTTFYDAARSGLAMALNWNLIGPIISSTFRHEAHVIVPSLYFNPLELPPIDGDNAGKVQTVTGAAQFDTVTGKDFNLWLRTDEATL